MPEGAIVVFSAHGVAPVGPRGGRRPQPADDRRDLPAGHQGPQGGQPVRRRRLRHPADRPRGPRGGHRHHRRGPRAHPAGRRPRRRRERRGPRPGRRWRGCRRPRCRSTRPSPRSRRSASGSRSCIDPPSDDICYATQNRQVAVKEIAAEAELVIVVGSANSSNSVRLVEVAKEHGADAAYLVDYADGDRRGVARGRRHGRADQRRVGARRSWSRACWPGSRSAASAASRRSSPSRSACVFALPHELRRDLRSA